MAFSCGFYNSVNHDRVYDAVEFGEMFDGLINDGVYATVGNAMTVAPVSGMTVKVRSGRAWFNKTWSVNSNDYPLTLSVSDMLLPRIDAVILEVDTRLAVRNNSLKVITGTPASSPQRPTLVRENGVYQYPLAWVNVRANVTSITASDIEIQVGRSPTPFVTGIITTADISDFWNAWDEEFNEWFDALKKAMGEGEANAIIAMQGQIQSLDADKLDKADKATVTEAQVATNDTKYMTPSKVQSFYNYRKATNTQANAGTNTDNFITPASLKSAIDDRRTTFTDLASTSDSDKVVFSNIFHGFWNSTNAYATQSQVTAGTSINRYVRPDYLRTAVLSWISTYAPKPTLPSSGISYVSLSPVTGETVEMINLAVFYYGSLACLTGEITFITSATQSYEGEFLLSNAPLIDTSLTILGGYVSEQCVNIIMLDDAVNGGLIYISNNNHLHITTTMDTWQAKVRCAVSGINLTYPMLG